MTNFKCDEDQALVFVDGVLSPVLVCPTWDMAEDIANQLNSQIGTNPFYSDRATDLVPDTRAFLDFPNVGYYIDADARMTGRRSGYVVADDFNNNEHPFKSGGF